MSVRIEFVVFYGVGVIHTDKSGSVDLSSFQQRKLSLPDPEKYHIGTVQKWLTKVFGLDPEMWSVSVQAYFCRSSTNIRWELFPFNLTEEWRSWLKATRKSKRSHYLFVQPIRKEVSAQASNEVGQSSTTAEEEVVVEDEIIEENAPIPSMWNQDMCRVMNVEAANDSNYLYRSNEIVHGAMYGTKKEVKEAVKLWAMSTQRTFRVTKTSKDKYSVKCKSPDCEGYVHASVWKYEVDWIIRRLVPHTCIISDVPDTQRNISSSNKRRVEAQREGEGSAKRQSVTMGLETLDCSVCSEPLWPPIFQCSLGHFICSSCRCKLLDKKCHLCSVKTSFERCFGMEHVVQSVTVPCSNAKYGCAEKVTYYQKKEHEKACLIAPCFCLESGCSFAGPAEVLMDHFTAQHKCPLTTFDDSNLVNVYLSLQPGLHVLHCCKDSHFFLFNMASEPFGHAISVVCVQPKVTGPKFTCDMYYSSTTDDSQSSCCKIRNSSLSDGLPTGYDLIVPKGKVSDEGNGIMIRATIRGERRVLYETDSDANDPDYSDSDSDDELPLAARLARAAYAR